MKERILNILQEGLIFGVLSDTKKNKDCEIKKMQIKPFVKDGIVRYQASFLYDKKVKHQNCGSMEELAELLERYLTDCFCQGVLYTRQHDCILTCFQKLKVRSVPPTKTQQSVPTAHDKQKQYILKDGEPCPFLYRLGVCDEKGKVFKAKYDKFRQINKYLELVADCIPDTAQGQPLRIVDFGCGKAYLTFALYHYLVNIRGLCVEVVGLDLKEDVIAFCNQVANDLGFTHLTFCQGDIKSYDNRRKVDMVVTLHACDTATDDALVQAVKWECQTILSVPCCQHELFRKIAASSLTPLLKHGILKERFSALATDAIRGQLLEACGYQVQIMEFISMEHTPKNILIKAIKKTKPQQEALNLYRGFAGFLNIDGYLYRRLMNEGLIGDEKNG